MSSWYVRKGGSDNNGGSSSGTSPDRSGTDMAVTNGSTQVTSASGAFSAGDVGKGINISAVLYRIATYTNSTTIQLERNYTGTTGSGKTWKIGGALATISKILGLAAAIMQNGDTLYIGAGTYREIVTCAVTGLTAETFVVGDVTGANTGDSGDVVITPYLTNDKTAPSASTTLTVKSFLTFQSLIVMSSSGGCIAGAAGVANVSLKTCVINAIRLGLLPAVTMTGTAGAALNFTMDRCVFVARPSQSTSHRGIQIIAPRHTADYDLSVLIENTLIVGAYYGVFVGSNGSGAGFGGGVTVRGTTIASPFGVVTNDANLSTTYPVTVTGCLLVTTVGLSANTTGQIVEDWNIIYADTARSAGVTAGAHSVVDGSYAPMLELGAAWLLGRNPRPMWQPYAAAPQLGFWTPAGTAYDILNDPRPAGGGSTNYAAGAYERGNSAVQELSVVDSDTSAIRIDGPGYQDFDLAVDAVPTTVTIRTRHDSTYAGTLPQMLVRRGAECGVSPDTATAVQGADTWETLSLTFTPTRASIVTIRVQSNDTNGAGRAYFDTFVVA